MASQRGSMWIGFAAVFALVAAGAAACTNGSGGAGGANGSTSPRSNTGSRSSSGAVTVTATSTQDAGADSAGDGGVLPDIACPNNACNVLGLTAHDMAYTDAMQSDAGTSTGVLATGTACLSGTTGQATDGVWGAQLSFVLGTMTDAGMAQPVQLTGSGVNLHMSLTSDPPRDLSNVTLNVFVGPTDGHTFTEYCVGLSGATAGTDGLMHFPWSAFTKDCWSPGGAALTAAPNASVVSVQMNASSDGTANYTLCVQDLSIQP